jgi:hypothetical protein
MTDFLGYSWNFWLNSENPKMDWTRARQERGRFCMENTKNRGSKGVSELDQKYCKDCGWFWKYWGDQDMPDPDVAVYCRQIDDYTARSDKVCWNGRRD